MSEETGAKVNRGAGLARRVSRGLAVVLLLGVVAFLAFFGGAYLGITRSLPDLDLEAYSTRAPETTKIFDNSDPPVLLAELRPLGNRQILPGDRIPQAMRDAVVAVEDENFYAHKGASMFSLISAAWAALRGSEARQESSTITQQLVRHALLPAESASEPELTQAALAYRLEGQWSKEKILNEFLNVAYFGHGAYGVQAAALTYFGLEATALSTAQAALLAGLLDSPSAYSPFRDREAALARRNLVLNKMYQQHYLTSSQLQEALTEPLGVGEAPAEDSPQDTAGANPSETPSAFWINLVREQLVTRYGVSAALGGGLRVSTTLVTDLQAAAEGAVAGLLARADSPAAALLSLDLHTGGIVALVGVGVTEPWRPDGTSALGRQLGSAFNPFLVVTALEKGFSPETVIETSTASAVSTADLADTSAALSATSPGPLTLAAATAHVADQVFVRLAETVGSSAVAETSRRLGLGAPSGHESAAALGRGVLDRPVNLLELASAYAALAANGESLKPSVVFDPSRPAFPISILKVKDSEGALIDQNAPTRTPLLDPGLAELTTRLLRGVVDEGAARGAALGRPVAAQPGSTPDRADAWFIGYTPELLTIVWVGYPDSRRPLDDLYGEGVTGVNLAMQIWTNYMSEALAALPATSFSEEHLKRFVTLEVCSESGLLPAEYCPSLTKRLFRTDSIPVEICPLHAPKEVPVPRVTGLPVREALAVLTAARFEVSQVMDRMSLQPAGSVVQQKPKAGSLLLQGRTVVLVVSTGENRVTVPSVIGLTLEQALARLAGARLSAEVTYAPDSAPAGTVLAQEPPPGSIVARGAKVRFTVSSGPSETTESTSSP